MDGSSVDYLWFAAASIALYWLVPSKAQTPVLAVLGTGLLAWWDLTSAVLLVALSAIVFLATGPRASASRWPLAGLTIAALGVGFVLLQLALEVARGDDGTAPAHLASLVAPIGLGFYVLRLIHYAVERRSGALPPHGFTTYHAYQLFFPALWIGPIHRFEDFARDERRRRWDPALFTGGLQRVLEGSAKVVVLAGWLVERLLDGQVLPSLEGGSAPHVLLASLSHGLRLYFVFSGYSDVAIGLGLMLGFRMVENFDNPFLKPNIVEFWRAWHVSLSDWCRRYVFLPIASQLRAPGIAISCSMLAIAAWHELSPRYLAWGLYHAAGIRVCHLYQKTVAPRLGLDRPGPLEPLLRGASTLLTFTFVVVGFTFTRSDDLEAALEELRRLLAW